MEAVFGDVLCPFSNCPPSRERKQRLVTEGTALQTESFSSFGGFGDEVKMCRDGGGWMGFLKGTIAEKGMSAG